MFVAARSQVCAIGSHGWMKTYGASSGAESAASIGSSSGQSGSTPKEIRSIKASLTSSKAP